jgi:undecaprenyl-diphosphatase
MNPFDVGILHFLNQFAHRSYTFDDAVVLLSANHLIKGGVIMALFWWAWFREDEGRIQKREFLLYGIISCSLALVVARILAHTIPFRERPLRNPALYFQMPYEMNDKVLIHWSSFPSDHAALFFTLAASIFLVWRRAGILALCHTFFIICLPRVYLGIHFPTDILAGALIGVAIASLAKIAALRVSLTRHSFLWLQKSPGTFYAFLFLVTFQIATLFDPAREIIRFVLLAPKFVFTVSLGLALLLYFLFRIPVPRNLAGSVLVPVPPQQARPPHALTDPFEVRP